MTEFSARIIVINRVVSQDRGEWTSMTLKARVFQPNSYSPLFTISLISLAMLDLQYCTCSNTESRRAVRHNGVGTINPCLMCGSVFYQHSNTTRNSLFFGGKRAHLISVFFFFFKRGASLQSLGTSASGTGASPLALAKSYITIEPR